MKYTIVCYENNSTWQPIRAEYELEGDAQAKAKLIEWVESGFRNEAYASVVLGDGKSSFDAYNRNGKAVCSTEHWNN